MADEIRTEEFVETEVVETEDVNENAGLTATEYAVIGGIMAAGVLVFEGGKWVWKKTAKPRGKVADFVRDHKPKKKAKEEDVEPQTQDQEVSAKEVPKETEEKKTEGKKGSKK
jgi:hypothetical protein